MEPTISKAPERTTNISLMGNAPTVDDKDRSIDFVKCGKDNLFREFLRDLADNCAPLNAVINTLALYIAGKRIVFYDANGNEVQRAADKWNELNLRDGEAAFRSRVAKDLSLLGDRCFEVVMSKAGPVGVYHMDAMRLRSGKKDGTGRVNEYHWCSNWRKYRKGGTDYPATTIPAFGSDGVKKSGKGIMFAKDYHQGQDYCGMPWYLPALTDAEVWSRIANYNRTQIDSGFRPSFHLHLFKNSDPESITETDRNIEATFTGSDGKGYILTSGTREEGAPMFTKLERGDHAGELDKMGDRSEMVIYRACGIPPILMGVDVATGMSGKGLALEQSVTQFIRTQVEPRQKFLTDDALRLVQLCGVTEAVHCEIEQLNPFDAATDAALQRQSYLRSVTVNEDRINRGMGRLTVDGITEDEGGVLDPRGFLLLIEAQGGTRDTTDTTDTTSEDA